MSNFETELRKAGEEILNRIGIKSQSYFLSGGMPSPSQVTSRTGGLLGAVMGGNGGIREFQFSGDTARFTIGVSGAVVPYAVLHEKGGTRVVTEKMRRFFWAKYFETSIYGDTVMNSMWSALRFKNVITFPKRSYLEPAVNDIAIEIPEILERYTMNYLKTTITQTIEESKRVNKN